MDPKKLLALARRGGPTSFAHVHRQYLEKEGAEIRQRMCPEQQEMLLRRERSVASVSGSLLHMVEASNNPCRQML